MRTHTNLNGLMKSWEVDKAGFYIRFSRLALVSLISVLHSLSYRVARHVMQCATIILAPLVRERAWPDRFMTSSTKYLRTEVVSPSSGVHP